jgi:hypothetical protein
MDIFVCAKFGKIEVWHDDVQVARTRDPKVIANALEVGESPRLFLQSSMDFADEYGFAKRSGAMKIFNQARREKS